MKKKKKKKGILLANTIVILTGMVTILILLFVLALSFFSADELSDVYKGAINPDLKVYGSFKIIPDHFCLEQYKNTLWMNSDFWYYFWNSVLVSAPIMMATAVVGTLGGYAFARFRFLGHKFFLFLFIMFMMVPNQVMIPSQFRLLYEMDLLNQSVSIILPNIFAPFGVYLIYQYAHSLPEDIFEAARIDGAKSVRTFLSIVLPNIKNGIIALLVLTLIDTWNMIEQPLVFLSDEYKFPLSVAINQAGGVSGMSVFVSSIVFLIPIFLVFMMGKDQLVEGIGQSIV